MIVYYFGLPFAWDAFLNVLVLGILLGFMGWILSLRPGPAGDLRKRGM